MERVAVAIITVCNSHLFEIAVHIEKKASAAITFPLLIQLNDKHWQYPNIEITNKKDSSNL